MIRGVGSSTVYSLSGMMPPLPSRTTTVGVFSVPSYWTVGGVHRTVGLSVFTPMVASTFSGALSL